MTVYHNGDAAELTGNVEEIYGRIWLEARLTEGHRKGELIVVKTSVDVQTDIESKRNAWREQQDQFARLHSGGKP